MLSSAMKGHSVGIEYRSIQGFHDTGGLVNVKGKGDMDRTRGQHLLNLKSRMSSGFFCLLLNQSTCIS